MILKDDNNKILFLKNNSKFFLNISDFTVHFTEMQSFWCSKRTCHSKFTLQTYKYQEKISPH